MKRKIGLLMAVLFALTLTSQTILALDHDPFDPRYDGTFERVATKDGEPWIDLEGTGNHIESDNKFKLLSCYDLFVIMYPEYSWLKIFVPEIIIKNNLKGTNNDEADGCTDNESTKTSQETPADM